MSPEAQIPHPILRQTRIPSNAQVSRSHAIEMDSGIEESRLTWTHTNTHDWKRTLPGNIQAY